MFAYTSVADPDFFHPGSASKNLSILTQKLIYDPGCSSRIRTLIFYPSRIPGSKRHRIPYPQHWFTNKEERNNNNRTSYKEDNNNPSIIPKKRPSAWK
jgi:hypothetical protein